MIGFILASLLVFASAMIIDEVLEQEIDWFDKAVYDMFHRLHSDSFTVDVIFLTHMGSAIRVIPIFAVALGVLIWHRQRIEAFMLTLALGGGGLLNYILKMLFRRERPDIEHLVSVNGYSFPSGHAMVSFIFYGMLGYLAWYYLRNYPIGRWITPAFLVVFSVSIGCSRIYLGVHYASDVIAGFTIGGVWLTACILGLHLLHWYVDKQKKVIE
ncbi:hypothetical protein AM501_24950 [Aneurinibacillus migulanus]|uniref:Undecaprenyl-diphosphatase n=1 Tax=Aneurinibacillus migulanus TaxID=47500 RepID=A0A0M0GZD2_ANEMI|nr:phosphatase PAP2 family protein [Aneurinibacillus migulanus]KON95159.1 hypothetical protein AF333_06350 [Aneurinibacillus migulanus]KPD05649.1 hypothetical protein AM501_24950 [Aneurinibacillus migulanus]MED0890886.1 phosphatase PAP2 family protein [Aneurinibacillus migulanus]MED1616578.1 phosphatase PAP2 family protein [Aneurinibacillus migulanus]MED4729488.1 phosphatase PAP2 family protein [Aneurinibacillus migulanus]